MDRSIFHQHLYFWRAEPKKEIFDETSLKKVVKHLIKCRNDEKSNFVTNK